METFWYWLTQVHLAKWPLKWRERMFLTINRIVAHWNPPVQSLLLWHNNNVGASSAVRYSNVSQLCLFIIWLNDSTSRHTGGHCKKLCKSLLILLLLLARLLASCNQYMERIARHSWYSSQCYFIQETFHPRWNYQIQCHILIFCFGQL